MSYIKELLDHLLRADVTEVALATARNPCAKVNGVYEIVDRTILSSDEILMMLMVAGGVRYVDNLGAKPLTWGCRVDGIGPVTVAAVLVKGSVQARFTRMNPEAARASGLASAPPPPGESSPGPLAIVPQAPLVPRIDEAPATVASPIRSALVANPSGSFDIDLSFDDAREPSSAKPVSTPSSSPPSSSPPSSSRSAPLPVPPALDLGAPTFDLDIEPRAGGSAKNSPPAHTLPAGAPIAPLLVELAVDKPAAAPAPAATVLPQGHAALAGVPIAPLIVELDVDKPAPAHGAAAVLPPPRTSVRVDFRVEDSVDSVLLAARAEGASDLHLVAGRPALFRLAGRLVPRGETIAPEVLERVLLPRIPARLLSLFERDGSCDFALQGSNIGRARANVTRQRTGLKGSFRLVPNEIPTLAGLGLPEAIGNATHHHQGLIVITGPTGHGKTTTMAAIVDIINSNTTHHVITVEDPIEVLHPRKKALMSQREVGTNTRSFAAALKGSLREDPDVIVVGELRDTETVRMALSASETGHLVLGTMNTPSAAKTIDRLVDLFPPGDQAQVRVTLAGGLRLIVSQRLLPRKDGPGMVVAAELLPGSVPLWNLIRENKTYQIPSLQQRGKGFGIIRLDDSLAELVNTFKVSAEDAIAVADNPEELDATLSGKRVGVPPPVIADPVKLPQPTSGPPDSAPGAAAGAKGLLGRAGALFGKKGGS